MVRMIVDRLHVSASSRDVIRAIRKALKPSARKARKHRTLRHQLYRDGLAVHEENRQLYRAVMSGKL